MGNVFIVSKRKPNFSCKESRYFRVRWGTVDIVTTDLTNNPAM
jgi:hypothetical protein